MAIDQTKELSATDSQLARHNKLSMPAEWLNKQTVLILPIFWHVCAPEASTQTKLSIYIPLKLSAYNAQLLYTTQ